MSGRRPYLRLLVLVALVISVPALPFVLLGEQFEARLLDRIRQDWTDTTRFWLIVGLLSVDVLLPVPSSGVSTYAGGTLGIVAGTSASWLGMTLGAVAAFVLARILSPAVVERMAGSDLKSVGRLTDRYGPSALVFSRFLPLFAEASVLLAGLLGISWRRFLPPIIASNLVISLTYSAFGAYFGEREVLPTAIIISILMPLTVAILVRNRLPWKTTGQTGENRLEK